MNDPFGKTRQTFKKSVDKNSQPIDQFRFVTVFMCAVWTYGFLAADLYADQARPNIILIVVDDLGWADLGCYGSKFFKSPNVDRMASEGTRFTNAYAASPIGMPTRAALLTGRYPQRAKLTGSINSTADNARRRLMPAEVGREMPLSELTIAEHLKPAGYTTACIGKWHLGGKGFGPSEQGFDINIAGNATSLKYEEFAPYVDDQGNVIPGLEGAPRGEFLEDRLAAEAKKFITEHKSTPFFLYLPQFAIHMPSSFKAELAAKYGAMPETPAGKQINPIVAALVESMDESVGTILNTLDELQLSERTLVVLTSDNGGVCNGNGQIIPSTINAPLRDGMGHLYEGGLRVPMIARWPGVVKPGIVADQIVSCLDFTPTVLDACAVTPSKDPAHHLDGQSLLPLLRGTEAPIRDTLYWHYPHYNVNAGAKPGAAIRSGDWKLIEFYETGRQELFNVAKEPGEAKNLIEESPEIAKQLKSKLDHWRTAVGAKTPIENTQYIPNPQSDDGTIVLHSSTADVFGIMLRYEPLPHKDTLGFWVRQEDWASFEFTLKKPGSYRLVAHVGCGTNGGSLVQFEVADQKRMLTVPATGHFQNFVPQYLGTITLDKPGRYTLKVVPQKKEGVAVMDLRSVELKPE